MSDNARGMFPKKDKLHFQGLWETYKAPATSTLGAQSPVTTSLPSWEPEAGGEVGGTQAGTTKGYRVGSKKSHVGYARKLN